MFLDTAVIYAKAGEGGKGVVSFHREKYVPNGGPDGGDGGHGGNIYVVGDNALNTLIDFRYTQHFRAQNGEPGAKKNMFGKAGEDIVIKVPCGTVIKDAETGGILADVFTPGEKILLLEGGRGGRGNAKFASAKRRSPGFAENGEPTIERKLRLELLTIADVGLVGFPNVGKSTLLSVISAARPKIANYHFTTLQPNLGVVQYYDTSFVVADIPGLIEGASEGAGLGHQFLRHVERVRLIVHVVDISGSEDRDPLEDYKTIRAELKNYDEKVYNVPEIVVVNKLDLLDDESKIQEFEKAIGKKVHKIIAPIHEGTDELVEIIAKELEKLPPVKPLEFEKFEYDKLDKSSVNIAYEDGVYYVTGGYVEDLARKAYLDDMESFNWFQKKLRERGIIDMLHEKGAQDGDTICVLDLEFTLSE